MVYYQWLIKKPLWPLRSYTALIAARMKLLPSDQEWDLHLLLEKRFFKKLKLESILEVKTGLLAYTAMHSMFILFPRCPHAAPSIPLQYTACLHCSPDVPMQLPVCHCNAQHVCIAPRMPLCSWRPWPNPGWETVNKLNMFYILSVLYSDKAVALDNWRRLERSIANICPLVPVQWRTIPCVLRNFHQMKLYFP